MKSRTVAVSALAMLLLSACISAPDAPQQVVQSRANQLGLAAQSAAIGERWWESFDDPQLGRLIDEGMKGNPNLEAALARVRVADATVSVQRAAELPQVSADGQVLDQRFSREGLIPPPYAGTTRWVPTVQSNLDWDLDLFGRQRAVVAMARSDAEAAGLDAAEARLIISTSIAQTYIGLARTQQLITVTHGFVKTREDALALTRSKARYSLASEFDERTAETLLAQAQQAELRATEQRDLLIHALAALVGRGADFYPTLSAPTLALNKRPRVPDTLPADLLGRRPDLLAGQARIDAAVSGEKVARADFLPDVDLMALAGLASVGFGNFLSAGATTYGGGVAIHVPIFEGGRLRAQYRRASADLDAAVANYNDSVLRAVRESADALTKVRSNDSDLAQQDRIVAGLRDTVRLDAVRTSTGLGSKLDAIDSGFRLLEAEQERVNLQAEGLSRRVQLIAALGGGFISNPTTATTSSSGKSQ
ncbi:efflux transporter outer membrane subunit [Burkholderia sp. L27(2015)]|uniref:efflux transporter outer membrane subunit n=1 Tax=Burkholderia sp. L27(2015) TaxID=1641858 RepID=UPI00131B9D6D|nr:efflux transporter outer membrane subunit [Burkholderia sp. L27(2015)]